MPTETLSLDEARKLVLHAQRLPPTRSGGSARSATLSAFEHLGYIQIDSLSVIQRAHHHTLWNRNPRYRPDHLDSLLESGEVFEYWAHAAAYLPMRDYRFSLRRKRAFATGEQEHWFDRNETLEREVLRRIEQEGPLMAKDFKGSGTSSGVWKTHPAKRALENLFMQGDLMAPHRDRFQKVYDLPERVLPAGVDLRPPSEEEQARFLIARFLQAHGLGRATEITYLLPGAGPGVSHMLDEMLAAGELLLLRVGELDYHALPSALASLDQRLNRRQLKILSPFDNLLIQRRRMLDLFGFDYQIECYLPAAKRRYGYFSLPILWDGRLVARMDCKVHRKDALLQVHHLALEPNLKNPDRLLAALDKELAPFMDFNACRHLQVDRTTPPSLRSHFDTRR